MKVTFLGSSHGVPEPNRRCSCILIQAAGRYYVIDMGLYIIEDLQSRNIPVEAISCVFVTHMHGDHTNGLISFADLLSWYFKDADPLVLLPKMEAVPVIEEWLKLNGTTPRHLRYKTIKAGIIYDDGILKMTAIPNAHTDCSYSFLMEGEGKRLLFTGDLKRPSADYPAIQESLDLVVCEAAHFSAEAYVPLFQGKEPGQVCITHWTPQYFSSILALKKAFPALTVTPVYDSTEVLL